MAIPPRLPPHMQRGGVQNRHSSRPSWAFENPWINNPRNPRFQRQEPGQIGRDGEVLPPLPQDPSAPLPPGYNAQGTPGSPFRNPEYAGMQYNDRQRQYWIDQFGSDEGWNRFQSGGPGAWDSNQDRRDARTDFYQNQWDARMNQGQQQPTGRYAPQVGAQAQSRDPRLGLKGMGAGFPSPGLGQGLVSALSRAQQGQMTPQMGRIPQGKSGFGGGQLTPMPQPVGPGPGPIRQNPPPGSGKGGFGGQPGGIG